MPRPVFPSIVSIALGIALSVLPGCHARAPQPPDAAQLLSLPEQKPFPVMDAFRLDEIAFGFVFKLSQIPGEIGKIPAHIDVDKTIYWNTGEASSGERHQLRQLLQNLRHGELSAIAVNGVPGKLLSMTGPAIPASSAGIGTVTYTVETTPALELLSFRKEFRPDDKQQQEGSFNSTLLLERLTTSYGTPHYTHVKANRNGTFTHFWWGADDKVLLTDKGYDYLNATHWNGFSGKTFCVSVHQYHSGEVVIAETMKDNYRAMRNQARSHL